MLGLQLSVSCPDTPNLQREYAMFFNLDTAAEEPSVQAHPAAQEAAPASGEIDNRTASRQAKPRTLANRVTTPLQPIAAASRYLVQPGDSLSDIVARISDRPPGLWPAVNVVFEANPQAFIDGDINLVKAGSWLAIPDLYQALGQIVAPAAVPAVADESAPALPPVADTVESYEGPTSQPIARGNNFNSGFVAPSVAQAHTAAEAFESAPAPTGTSGGTDAGPVVEPESSEFRPGEISRAVDSRFVSAIDTGSSDAAASAPTVVIADTAIRRTAPVRATDRATSPLPAMQDSSGLGSRSWSGLAWLGGAGVAVFLGLLLFGRQVREKFGSTPIGDAPAAVPQRRRADPERRAAAPAAVDFAFDSVSDIPSMSLDADLGLGTGLRGSSDIDVAQDFGFSARHDVAQDIDLELPPVTDDEPEQHTTDIIPPHRMAEPPILESAIPPSDDNDKYDLSMILDDTREPIVDTHLTAKDLRAVPVGMANEDDETQGYTLDREIDYKVLEQDYEEEFTATQALNEEMARAALELTHTMSGNISTDQTVELPRNRKTSTLSSDPTVEMPRRAGPEITAELTGNLLAGGDAVNDDLIIDLDDTGVNEELTAELSHGDHEVTAELAIEGGRVDTKRSRVDKKKTRAF
jgi:hypothetical protein